MAAVLDRPALDHSALGQVYDRAFFAEQIDGSSASAAVVVPRILALFPETKAVVDVGCGTGIWLRHFRLAGVPRLLGIDGGDPADGMLQIAPEEFVAADLTRPLPVQDRFGLCLSLEVAEHLPRGAAERFVADLCRLSDVVVFSAAIPGQGGTRHVNERWQSYWAALFAIQGYDCFDVLRPDIWYDRRVEWWYAQNILVFAAAASKFDSVARLRRTAGHATVLDVVHPRSFEAHRKSLEGAISAANDWRAERAGLLDEISLLRARIDEDLAENDALRAERAGLLDEVSPLRAWGGAAAADNAALRAELVAQREWAQAACAQADSLRGELRCVLTSNTWRATAPLRRALEPWPGVRRLLSRSLKLVWWTGTGQLPARWRAWRKFRR